MSDFDFNVLKKRIQSLQKETVDLDELVNYSYQALSLLQGKADKSDFLQPESFIELHGKQDFSSLKKESENLAAYYRVIYLCGFLYTLLAFCPRSPLALTSIDKVRLSFSTFNDLNQDEKVAYLLRYRFKDFIQTARWVGEDKEFSEVIAKIREERDLVMGKIDHYLASGD